MSAYRERAAGYLREGVGGVNIEKVLTLALLGAAVFIGYKIVKAGAAGAKFAGDALNVVKAGTDAVGSALGQGLYDIFHPNETEQITSTDYMVYFPDEKVFKTVNSLAVDLDGGFAIKGKFYDLVILKTPQIMTHPVSGKPFTFSKVAKRVL